MSLDCSRCQEGSSGSRANIPIANPCVYTSTGSFRSRESHSLLGVRMFVHFFAAKNRLRSRNVVARFLALTFSLSLILSAIPASAQDQTPPPSDNGKPKQDVPAESGGPGGDV